LNLFILVFPFLLFDPFIGKGDARFLDAHFPEKAIIFKSQVTKYLCFHRNEEVAVCGGFFGSAKFDEISQWFAHTSQLAEMSQ